MEKLKKYLSDTFERDSKYFREKTRKHALWARFFAKSIDLGVVIMCTLVFYPFGIILALTYLVICDSMNYGQSLGKRIVGFSVISLEDGLPCTIKQSFIRNLPLIIPVFLLLIPFWGWFFALFSGLPMLGMEVYFLTSLGSGHRLGDVMADTTVHSFTGTLVVPKKNSSWFEEPIA